MSVILTTGEKVEGKEIKDYVGIIHGEACGNIGNYARKQDTSLGYVMSMFSGGQINPRINDAEGDAIVCLRERAESAGCDAVIGVRTEFQFFQDFRGYFNVVFTATGTGVKLNVPDTRTEIEKQADEIVTPTFTPTTYDACKTAADVVFVAKNKNDVSQDVLEKLEHTAKSERLYGNMLEDAMKILKGG